MARNSLQDIKINRIKKTEAPEKIPEKIELKKAELFFQREPKVTAKKSSYSLWFIAGISLVFLLFAFSFLFAGAQIIVNPKMQSVDVPATENLSAIKDTADSTDSSGTDLTFDLVTISGQETQNISSTGTKNVSLAATGNVILYNAFSAEPQKLLINTRLQGSNGKIYKIDSQVTIPGMTGTTPGSIAVGVHASDAGADYNSGPLDFKVVGFQGTPRYDAFYGRSNGSIAGGFSGNMPQVSDADKNNAVTTLQTTLQSDLWQKVTAQIPPGFVLFKNAAFLSLGTTTIDTPASGSNQVSITQSGTLYGFIFDEKKLTDTLATDLIPAYDGSDVYISNLQSLPFNLTTNGTGTPSYADITNINFTLTGTANFVWRVDADKLATDMLGKNKSDFNQVLSGYPNITSANLIVKPIWKNSLPDNPNEIKVTVNYPN